MYMDTALLIREAKQGSAAAQKLLYDHWSGRMHVLCRRYVKVAEDAEEIMLDGFYKFYKTIHRFHFNGEAALHEWLKRIMINECLMYLRRKKSFTMIPETDIADIGIEEAALNNLSATEIFNLIVQLPVGYRTVFNLHVVEGMDHREIAKLLGISEGTSKSQLSRAKTLLQKMIVSNETIYGRQSNG